ncbi:hypothetical protein [Clostridium minihomine]|uniref:hypothetical protein n=1 Tax=Clostridium minihomine TaxID=2045012 RepID=UPI0013EC4BA0|nr:hypothetical protein [Clostridium minihomine]
MAERAKKGIFCGGVPPLGYDIVDGNDVINEQKAEMLCVVFDAYADGASYHAISVFSLL